MDRRTDRTKLVVDFRNSESASKNFTVRTGCSYVPAVPKYRLFLSTGCSYVPAVPTYRLFLRTGCSSNLRCALQVAAPLLAKTTNAVSCNLELSAISDQSADISNCTVQSGTVTLVIPFQHNSTHRSITPYSLVQ